VKAKPDRFTTTVTGCARCGEQHVNLEFHRRPKPLQIGSLLFFYWAHCPTTNELLNLRIAESKEDVRS
jgi:hypothetical protein